MRSAPILIAVFLLVGAALLTYLPSVSARQDQGPGSYPIGSSRFQWPVKVRRAAFHPMKATGTDELPPSSVTDAKTQCLKDCPAISPKNRADAFL
jgi:hypothetical protein